ncbi:MAG: HAMP domain-containing protein, partial [Ilumatobacteraceae bacterium]
MAIAWTPTLRAKSLAVGCVIALVVSLIASSATYLTARRYLLNQREAVAIAQTFAAARLVAGGLADGQEPLDALLEATRGLGGSQALLKIDSKWLVSGVGISETDIPEALKSSIIERRPSRQRTVVADKVLLFTAIPIEIATSPNTTFVGIAPLVELDRALTYLRNALGIGIILATFGGGVIGLWLSRRISEPLHTISNAAAQISAGDLKVRINEPREPDLAMIARSFNTMTASMQERAERDIRFAGHISHELKSPLTVIRGAAELVASRRAELPERAQFGVDLLI